MVATEAYYAQYDEYVKACRSGLEAANEVPIETMSTYVGAMSDYLNQLSNVIDEMKTIGTNDTVMPGTQQWTRFYDLQNEYYTRVRSVIPAEMSSQLYQNLSSKMDGADPIDELNALDEQLQKSWAVIRR